MRLHGCAVVVRQIPQCIAAFGAHRVAMLDLLILDEESRERECSDYQRGYLIGFNAMTQSSTLSLLFLALHPLIMR